MKTREAFASLLRPCDFLWRPRLDARSILCVSHVQSTSEQGRSGVGVGVHSPAPGANRLSCQVCRRYSHSPGTTRFVCPFDPGGPYARLLNGSQSYIIALMGPSTHPGSFAPAIPCPEGVGGAPCCPHGIWALHQAESVLVSRTSLTERDTSNCESKSPANPNHLQYLPAGFNQS